MKGPISVCFIIGLLIAASPLMAGVTDVAVVHIGVDNTGVFGIDNAVNYLLGDARFTAVANIDVDAGGVPNLAQLSAYGAVMVVTDNRAGSNTGGGLGTQLGNVLDDYVYAGGRVVLTTFCGNVDIGVDGDILSLAPYQLMGLNAPAGSLDMATAVLSHPVFDGVSSFSSQYASDIDISPQGILLGSYLSGEECVLTTVGDSVMFINGFPGNMSDYSNGSDFGLLFANALAIPASVIPAPGAVLLAGIGAGLVGWLRRRRMV